MRKLLIIFTTIIFLGGIYHLGIAKQPIPQKTLSQILEGYVKKRYSIIGPIQVTNISSKHIYFYKAKRIDKKNIQILDEKEKPTQLFKHDWVYILKKGKEIILIKIQKRGDKNE